MASRRTKNIMASTRRAEQLSGGCGASSGACGYLSPNPAQEQQTPLLQTSPSQETLRAPANASPPSGLHTYLSNSSWSLFKRLEYRRGGSFGAWSGEAHFNPDPTRLSHLVYTEVGTLRFDHQSKDSEGVASHAKPLSFDCSADPPCVRFIDDDGSLRHFYDLIFGGAADGEATGAGAAGAGAATLVHWPAPPTNAELGCYTRDAPTGSDGPACSFDHLCEQDLYTGEFTVTNYSSFTIKWKIQGPAKDGNIHQLYKRISPPSVTVAPRLSSVTPPEYGEAGAPT
jgi:hypothetical protein